MNYIGTLRRSEPQNLSGKSRSWSLLQVWSPELPGFCWPFWSLSQRKSFLDSGLVLWNPHGWEATRMGLKQHKRVAFVYVQAVGASLWGDCVPFV